MRPKLQAKLLAYKAYKLGRYSVCRQAIAEDAAFVQHCLFTLQQLPQTAETLRRRLFYTLILAEMHRPTNPVEYRKSALELGRMLESEGCPNPFPLFMKIVEATSQPPTTGNFGDIRTASATQIRDTTSFINAFGDEVVIDLAQRALKLTERDLEGVDRFLQMSLREVARSHDLVTATPESGTTAHTSGA
jgi:hypothetical protein